MLLRVSAIVQTTSVARLSAANKRKNASTWRQKSDFKRRQGVETGESGTNELDE